VFELIIVYFYNRQLLCRTLYYVKSEQKQCGAEACGKVKSERNLKLH